MNKKRTRHAHAFASQALIQVAGAKRNWGLTMVSRLLQQQAEKKVVVVMPPHLDRTKQAEGWGC